MSETNEGVGGTSAKVAQHAREAQITLPRCTGTEKKTTKERHEDINTQTALLGPRRRQTHKEPSRTKCKVWLYEHRA